MFESREHVRAHGPRTQLVVDALVQSQRIDEPHGLVASRAGGVLVAVLDAEDQRSLAALVWAVGHLPCRWTACVEALEEQPTQRVLQSRTTAFLEDELVQRSAH